ncbi:NADH-quinone oxidoreductase subunit G [Flaviflexus huanghaiensis]|uniref:NADH-quinone oxidoreductase subunit G n=1 Tax=Flaviflexus huanghaiensis TaxID=1111473 RepID=UPI0015FE123B|nr:NADH-quinone oxidoreductase subunit G [Flaviflexus huanghaiensis]
MTATETDLVSIKVDGQDVAVPQGTLIIRAAEQLGIRIPRFCDHPLLKPAGACRQCLVEVARPGRDGTLAKGPKPVASCAEAVSQGMEVYTQKSSDVADKAQTGIMEFLLINHPLDCPVCDKGGECPLQNQAMSDGRGTSRFTDVKRTFPKPIKLSSQILLDRDRCILCQRCTRFQSEIAGDPFIQLQGRSGGSPSYEVHGLHGSQIGNFDAGILGFSDGNEVEEPVGTFETVGPMGDAALMVGMKPGPIDPGEMDESGRPFSSYFSGNTIQICPVGALTSAAYRFRARPFDLVSVPSVTEHDASGSEIRVDFRRGTVVRRLAGNDPEVNEEWITDKDRFAFRWQQGEDRLTVPLVRDEDGSLVPTSWADAMDVAARGLENAEQVGVLTGGRLPLEDVYAYSKFARTVLGTNNIDFRTRVSTAEEDAFLASTVVGSGLGVTYADIETARHVFLVGLEPEEECGSIFLRLRKGVLAGTTSVSVLAPYATRSSLKMAATLITSAPGTEPTVMSAVTADSSQEHLKALHGRLKGGVILVGERAAETPGTLSAVLDLADRTGARVQWVPRRAGDRAAVEAGAVPLMLPGGRPVADSQARVDAGVTWDASVPGDAGLNTEGMLEAAKSGKLALISAGVELADLPAGAAQSLDAAPFVISFEVRRSEITAKADVVFPVAPPVEKGGTFINWEGRERPFGQVLTSTALTDRQVLVELAHEMDKDLGLLNLKDVHAEYRELADWDGQRIERPRVGADSAPAPAEGEAVLATWSLMIDDGRLQAFEPHLAGTAHRSVARLSPGTAESLGISDRVTVTGPKGSVTLPVVLSHMPDRVVWLPKKSPGCHVADLGAQPGGIVSLTAEVK